LHWVNSDLPADLGGLLPGAGETGYRLGANTRFLSGISCTPFAAYLVWEKREILRGIKIAPCWSGIAVIAMGLFVLLLGVYGSELFLSRVR